MSKGLVHITKTELSTVNVTRTAALQDVTPQLPREALAGCARMLAGIMAPPLHVC